MKILLSCQAGSQADALETSLLEIKPGIVFPLATTDKKLPEGPLLVILDSNAPSSPLQSDIRSRRQENSSQQPIRVLLATAEPNCVDLNQIVNDGIDDILTLPCGDDELLRRIELNCLLITNATKSTTEQNKFEHQLEEKEQRYRDLFNNMRSGVAVYTTTDDGEDFIFLDFNTYAEQIDNLNREELLGKKITDVFPAARDLGFIDVFKRVWKTGKPEHHPVSIYQDERLQGWRENYIYRLPSGELVAIYDDVTEKKQAEIELQKSRERLDFALHGANSGIWDWDLQTDNLFFDENYYKIAGYQPNEFPCAYQEWHKRVHPDDVEEAMQTMAPTIEGKEDGFITEFRFKTKNGDWMWILGQGKAIACDSNGTPTRVTGMHTNIDRSKKAESALRASESRLASILSVAPTGIGVVINRVIYAPNQRLSELTGYSMEELEGISSRQLYMTDEEFNYVGDEKYRQISTFGTGMVETQFVRKDGKIIDVLLSSTPLNADDLTEGVTFTALDITAQKQAEKALQESEENLRTILNSIGDAVIATDFQQRIINFNPVAEQLTGWNTYESIGEQLNRVFYLTDAGSGKSLGNIVNTALSAEISTEIINHAILKTKQGTDCHIACSIAPIIDFEGSVKGAVLVFRDIAEELRTREDLQRIQTLERIGILAGGIAHDFNNILMGLFGNITLAKRKLETEHPSYKKLQKAEDSAERAKNLTGKLLTFAKGGEPIREHISLADLVKDVAQFDLSGSNVKLTFNCPANLWAANGDKGQIQQVFSNLTTNAKQAMPDGGELHITLENLDNTSHQVNGLGEEKYIKATVKDTGTGISSENLKRIYDPYFSTKQTGSGLGLATVYSIIHKHKGQIEVESSPGAGTTFILYIPATDAQPTEQKDRTKQQSEKNCAGAKILIMDDEAAILDLATEMLESMGHSVVTASDCTEAAQRYLNAWEQEGVFDLVILDLTIPGGPGGLKAAQEVLAINPEAKILVASGYAEDPVMSRCEDFGFKGAISKPYTPEELQKALEQCLAD